MVTIGRFRKDGNGRILDGRLFGLGLNVEGIPVLFYRDTRKKENNDSDYQLYVTPIGENGYLIGNAWDPAPGCQHYDVKLESPWIPTPVIEAFLLPDKGDAGILNL